MSAHASNTVSPEQVREWVEDAADPGLKGLRACGGLLRLPPKAFALLMPHIIARGPSVGAWRRMVMAAPEEPILKGYRE